MPWGRQVMSNKPIVISLLWKQSAHVLMHYLQRNPAHIATLHRFITDELRELLARNGDDLIVLDELFYKPEPRQSQEIYLSCERLFMSDTWKNYTTHKGLSATDLAPILLANLKRDAEHSIKTVDYLDEILARNPVSLIVVNEDVMPFARICVEWGKARGIPVLHIEHGPANANPYSVHNQLNADCLAIAGKRTISQWQDLGFPTEKLRVTGYPGLDGMLEYVHAMDGKKLQLAESLKSRLGLPVDLPLIVFFPTWFAPLTASAKSDIFHTTLSSFMHSAVALLARGVACNFVVKDRYANEAYGSEWFNKVLLQIDPEHRKFFAYVYEDSKPWVTAADVVVSVFSSITIEAMMAGVPAINLLNDSGLRCGPNHEAECGIVEVADENLAEAIASILQDAGLRQYMVEQQRSFCANYNRGIDGMTSQRLIALMEEMALKNQAKDQETIPSPQYVWQTHLNVSDVDATEYHNWPRSELVDMAPRIPEKVLDIGCAAGRTGEYIKQKFPKARVYGVEMSPAAAEQAAKRLDGVFVGKFEDFNFADYGIEFGSLDTVIVADVLEHIYDPWKVMVDLRPYLAEDAQILASIPNVRTLSLMKNLAEGQWRYEPWGILDVTHIRFFTLAEIRRFFQETGYQVAQVRPLIDPNYMDFYQANWQRPLSNIELGRVTLNNVTGDELEELCALQFCVVARPLSTQESTALARQAQAKKQQNAQQQAYDAWRQARQLTPTQVALYEQRIAAWSSHPRFHLVVIYTSGNESYLSSTIQSLANQYYGQRQLTIVSTLLPPQSWTPNTNLSWRTAEQTMLLAEINQAVEDSAADWIGIVNAGDIVAPQALLFLAEALSTHPEWEMVYSDEDLVSDEGLHHAPTFKPDLNQDMLRSMPYLGGLLLVSRKLYSSLRGVSPEMLGAEEYDLALRAFERVGVAGIGHVPDVLYHRRVGNVRWELAQEAREAIALQAVVDHVARLPLPGVVEPGMFSGSHRVRYALHEQPKVSILVAVRDHLAQLAACIESVLANTVYPDYELLLLDNGSTHADTLSYLQALEAQGDKRVRVYRQETAAPLAVLHNLLAQHAAGDYLLFLYFDATVSQSSWLSDLMAHALRPDVGLVAPRMLAPDGVVAQTGIVLGMNNGAGTIFSGQDADDGGYLGRAHLEQNFSALGGGALLVRTTLFRELDGFDTTHFAHDFAEVDFSLRARARGVLAVWTPFVNVMSSGLAAKCFSEHQKAVPQQPGQAIDALYLRWLPELACDPAYNINLGLGSGMDCKIEDRAMLNWNPMPWRPLPRVLGQPGDTSGCGEYRVYAPMRALVNAGKVQGKAEKYIFSPPEMQRLDVDSVVLQRQVLPEQVAAIKDLKKFSRALRVFELDDLLVNLPMKSAHAKTLSPVVISGLYEALAMCDRFVVSTVPLKAAYHNLSSDIRVVPNRLERARWDGFKPMRQQSRKPRVGWAGASGHGGDLEMISGVVESLADHVDWIFLGMCPEVMRPWVKEFHLGVPLHEYPQKLASLNLDLAIAPLENNQFNEAKSNLRLLEYGILGYPVICTDIYPYQGDIPVMRVRNKQQEWIDAILNHVSNLDNLAERGDNLREHIQAHWMLEDHLDEWMQAWLP